MKYHIIRNSDERGKFLPKGVFLALVVPRKGEVTIFLLYSIAIITLAFIGGLMIGGI